MIKRIDVGTDVAMIGAWDASRADASPGQAASQALHAEAEQGDLFLIETRADGGGPVELYLDEEVPPHLREDLHAMPRDFLLRLPSGRLVVGGVEDYRSTKAPVTTDQSQAIAMAAGEYRLRCFIRSDSEDEAPASEGELEKLVGAGRLARYDRMNKLGCLTGPATLLLFPALVLPLGWKLALGITAVVFIAYWHVLERILRLSADYRELREIVPQFRADTERPTFVLQLLRIQEGDDVKGGWIDLEQERSRVTA
jgi:hypothetical protein